MLMLTRLIVVRFVVVAALVLAFSLELASQFDVEMGTAARAVE